MNPEKEVDGKSDGSSCSGDVDTDNESEYWSDSESEHSEDSSDEEEELKELHKEYLNSRLTLSGVLEFDAMARLDDCVENYNSDEDPNYKTGDEVENESDMEEIDTQQALLRKLQKYQNIEKELESAKHLIHQLRDQLECPVCLDLPRSGPVPVCPNGHFVCGKCKTDLCPTCRVPMGNGTSLLAATVLNNSELECAHEDCKENFPWGDLEKHEANCAYRTVTCPYVDCNEKVALTKLVTHLIQSKKCCQDNEVPKEVLDGWYRKNFKVEVVNDDTEEIKEKSMSIHRFSGRFFAFHTVKSEGIFYFILVMFAPEAECSNFKFEIVVHDARSEPGDAVDAVRFQGSPLSIDVKKDEMLLYGTSEKFIHKIMKNSLKESVFSLCFRILVKAKI